MRFDPIKVMEAMKDGLSAVCASCPKYWMARDQGLPGHQCLAVGKCGSPIAGDDFSEYSGDLIGALDKFCFVCGNKATWGVRIKGRPRVLGVCRQDAELVRSLKPESGLPELEYEILSGLNPVVFQKPRKTLREAMIETEKEWADSS